MTYSAASDTNHAAGAPRSAPGRAGLRLAIDFGLPVAVYYLLRAAGTSVFIALLVGAVVSASAAAIPMIRHHHSNGMASYVAVVMLGGVGISLISGSTQFLLAKEALLTGVTGVWFIASVWNRRPLSYLFSRPLLEGRFRWPENWEDLWSRAPQFRRMWRVSSVLWGIGTLLDSVLRVVMAYTLPADLVPALGTGLYAGTSAILIVVTTIYYAVSGVYNANSPLYRPVDGSSWQGGSDRNAR